MSDTPDLRDKIAALFRHAPGETRLGDEPPGVIADAVLKLLPEGWDRFVSTIELLRDRLAETTRERDEARAEADDLRDGWREADQKNADWVYTLIWREVEFEAQGADTFAGADDSALPDSGGAQ